MELLREQSALFSLPADIHYLNGAFMSPQLRSVTAAGKQSVASKEQPYRIQVDDFFAGPAAIRQLFSQLVNNPDPERIALIPSVSYGMANVTRNINLKNREVVLAGEQFPSNVYPWLSAAQRQGGKVSIIAPPDDFANRGKRWNENLLDAITSRTAVVAISQVHWADGTRFDLEALRSRTREVGALLVIDGTQSLGAMPFDIQQIQPDALIAAGYKWLLGPYGLGVAYYGEYFDDGVPVEENWINRLHSEDFAGLVAYEEAYQPGAQRYAVGEHSSFVLVPMLQVALQQLVDWQPQRIQDYCRQISLAAITQIQTAGYWVEAEDWRASHLFGIRHTHMPLDKIKQALTDRQVYVSYRGSAIRVSPHVYNTAADMQVLAEVLVDCVS
ncbi:MAG TPA: aminotransferase class V-fold PLP-dependent enzyme [Flammeovirgaceae bacterium]|nr:aminotransferase class V-fold PLP-dependent enzyme [Flammeovirgaceae bacterium]